MTTHDVAELVLAMASLLGACAAFAAAVFGIKNGRKLLELHLSVNSRLDQMLTLTASSAHADGKAEGMLVQKAAMADVQPVK